MHGGLELCAAADRDVGGSVVFVHVPLSFDLVHCLEEVVKEGLEGEIGVIIGVHDADDEGDIA